MQASPTFPRTPDGIASTPVDAEVLRGRLRILTFLQRMRCEQYGEEVAEEWLSGHTPEDARQRWLEVVRSAQEEMDRQALLSSGSTSIAADSEVEDLSFKRGTPPSSLDMTTQRKRAITEDEASEPNKRSRLDAKDTEMKHQRGAIRKSKRGPGEVDRRQLPEEKDAFRAPQDDTLEAPSFGEHVISLRDSCCTAAGIPNLNLVKIEYDPRSPRHIRFPSNFISSANPPALIN